MRVVLALTSFLALRAQARTMLAVMTFRRPEGLDRTLAQHWAQQAGAMPLIVAQSVVRGTNDSAIVAEVLDRWAQRRVTVDAPASWDTDFPVPKDVMSCIAMAPLDPSLRRWPCVVHIQTATTAARLGPHGSKRESLRNLQSAILLPRKGGADFVVISEDDVVLSPDAHALLAAVRRDRPDVTLATAKALLRPGLVPDMADWTDYARASEMAEGLRSGLASKIDVFRAIPRTVVHTWFWQLSTTGVDRLNGLFSEALADPGHTRPDLSPHFATCVFCDPFCYDHLAELALQGQLMAAPRLPRVSQVRGVGMTYTEGNPTPAWLEDRIHVPLTYEFEPESLGLYWLARWFPQPRPNTFSTSFQSQGLPPIVIILLREPVIVAMLALLATAAVLALL